MSTAPDQGDGWIGTAEAAQILGVNRSRVGQLVARGFLPAVMHRHRLYYRRYQVQVIAYAREARKITGTLGRGA